MTTEGSSAFKLSWNPKQREMEQYLSAEAGYWIRNDIWRTDSEAYKTSGLRESRQAGMLADFSECRDAYLKLELKYYILWSLKNQQKSPTYVQAVLIPVIRLAGQKVSSSGTYSSFEEIDPKITEPLPEDTAPTVEKVYVG